MNPRFPVLIGLLGLLLCLAPAAAQPERPPGKLAALGAKLQGVAETYKKWGITFDVKKDGLFTGKAGPGASTLKVTSGLEDSDTLTMDVEAGLGRPDAAGVVVSMAFTQDADGVAVSGSGSISLKGTGIGGGLKYTREEGLTLDVGVEETFYKVGVKLGGDGKSPLKLGLVGGPVEVSIDPVKWVSRAQTVLPELAKKAGPKVGGVLIQTDMNLLAAALSHAALRPAPEQTGLTAVSLKRLLPALQANRVKDLSPLTAVRGLIIDRSGGDIQLLGISEPGQSAIPASFLVTLLRSVWKDDLHPYVSLDPDPAVREFALKPRLGGVSAGLETSQLMAELVDADYHLKSLVFGKLPVQGVTPVQQEAARLAVNAPVAQTTARFWYSPRPVEPGDVAVNRSAAADVIRFDTEPQLLTEVLRAEGPGARETGSAIESAAQQVSTQVTRALPGLEQLHPELRLKQLRQAFEISLAASILRLQSLPPPCKTLLNSVTQITLTPATFRTDFPVDRYKSPVLGTPREIVIWGGVDASVNLAAADLETDAALAALAPARTRGRWDGYSRRLAVGFEPEIVSERPLTGAQMARPHLMRADQLLRKRDLKGALESAKAALSLDAGAGEARRIRCEAFLRANRPEEMLAEASAWVKQSPQLSRAYFWRGVAYGELYRTPESLADAERAIRLAPRDWLPLTLRADAKKRSSDNAGAVADLTEALKLAPDSSFIYLERGYAWEAAKEKEKAVADFSQALAFNPTSARALYERASLYRDLEKTELALKDCERLFQVQPTAANLGFLASLRLLLNDAEGAVRDATQALTLERYRYQTYVLRSNAYRKLKRYDEALEDLRFGLGIVRDTGRDQYMIPILEQLEKELLELRKG